ncbi:MAG: hypothetical protein ACK4N1_10360 [Pseudorhizobium sp.]
MKSIARDLRTGISHIPSILDWTEQLVTTPFRWLGAGQQPLPSFAPRMTPPDLENDYQMARTAASAVYRLDPGGIDIVRKFCKSPRHQRADMDLSALPSEARVVLLTMSDTELLALGNSGPGAIRKFVVGKEHGVHGVPVIGVHSTPANDVRRTAMATDESVAWKAVGQRLKPYQSAAFKL